MPLRRLHRSLQHDYQRTRTFYHRLSTANQRRALIQQSDFLKVFSIGSNAASLQMLRILATLGMTVRSLL